MTSLASFDPWNESWATVVARLEKFASTALELLPMLAIGIVIVVLLSFVGRVIASLHWPFQWARNSFVKDTARQMTRAMFVVLGIVIALDLLDATALVGAILGTAGIVGIAVGFAFRDLIENHLAGLLLSLRHPFMPNDAVVIGDHAGQVVRLTSRATILLTADGNHLRIPNAVVFKSVVLNYSKNPTRRFDIQVGVGTEENLSEVQSVGVKTLQSLPAVATDPPPSAIVEKLGDSSVLVRFYGWVDQTQADFFKTRSESIRLLKGAIERAGMSMPEPTYRIHMTEGQLVSQPSVESQAISDTARDRHIDDEVARERASEGDLLSESNIQE